MNNRYWSILNCPSFRKHDINKFSESEVTCRQVWWPILGISALYLTNQVHTYSSEHTHTVNTHSEQWAAILLRRPRNSWGFGALIKGLTSVVVMKVEESAGIHSKI